MAERLSRVRWRLNEDGGGVVDIDIDRLSEVEARRYVINSLDELPPQLREMIRADGRAKGEILDPVA
jgi:hypothetical protein